MRTLIFSYTLYGHHLEYIHHIYNAARLKTKQDYIIAVPKKEWNDLKTKKEWVEAPNVTFFMLSDEKCQQLSSTHNIIYQSLAISKYVKDVSIEAKVDKVLMIALAGAIPFLPFFLSSRVKLSGIIYKISLRSPKKGIRKILDKIRYHIMAYKSNIDKVFILNDPTSTIQLNNKYNTIDRFVSLPDPVPQISIDTLINIKPELNIPQESKLFLHFGAMVERKGTLEILRAILIMPISELRNKTFVFAGKVSSEIYDEFYKLINMAKHKGANILLYDEFCSYEFLNNLCFSADCILIPYLYTDLSSGVLGYAAVCKTPVIGPSDGLIGELIETNNLGITICNISAETIANAIVEFENINISCQYELHNTVNSFTNVLLS